METKTAIKNKKMAIKVYVEYVFSNIPQKYKEVFAMTLGEDCILVNEPTYINIDCKRLNEIKLNLKCAERGWVNIENKKINVTLWIGGLMHVTVY